MIEVGLKVTRDATKEMLLAVEALGKTSLMIGVPEDKDRNQQYDAQVQSAGGKVKRNPYKGSTTPPKANNAVLAYVHNHGSPNHNIPARPTLEPGINDAKSDIVKYFEQAGRAVMENDASRADRALNAAGIKAVTAVKLRIRSNIPPPLSAKTLAARRRRGNIGTRTLTDTGQMLNAHTYVIKRKTR